MSQTEGKCLKKYWPGYFQYFFFARLKKGASPTHAWLVYVYWQQLHCKKAWTARQELGKVSGLQPVLEHNTFLQSLLGSPPLTMNSWHTLQSCFISFRSDELQRRSVATAPHSLEAAGINFKHPVLTSRLPLRTNWLIYRLRIFCCKQTGSPWVNCLSQAPQKHMGWKCLKGIQYPWVKWGPGYITQVGIAPHGRP